MIDITVNGRPWRVAVDTTGVAGQVTVSIKGRSRTYDASWTDAATLSLISLDRPALIREFAVEPRASGELRITTAGRTFHVTVLPDGKSNHSAPRADRASDIIEGPRPVIATMPGRIMRVLVAAGDRVAAGQAVVVVEAMKMENEMRAPKDGVVGEVSVQPGASVEAGTVLVVID
jgi:biotin carboxyl carrier protein